MIRDYEEKKIELNSIVVDQRDPHSLEIAASTLVVVDHEPDLWSNWRPMAEGSGLSIIGECPDGPTALSILRKSNPTIAFVDIHHTILSGMDVIRTIHKEKPEIILVAVTDSLKDEVFDCAMQNGASGFVFKPDLIREFDYLIATVLAGRRYVSEAVLDRLLIRQAEPVQSKAEESKLTAQQLKVIGLVGQGLSNKEIASSLNISESTIEKHRAAAMQRLGIRTSADLVRYVVTGRIDLTVSVQDRIST